MSQTTDLLSETVDLLRTQGQLYGRLEFAAPWGYCFPGAKGICLIVTRGNCFLQVDHQTRQIPLAGGDFVFLANPESYSLRSRPELPLRNMAALVPEEVFHRSRLIRMVDGDGPHTALIAGCFTFATPESEWLGGSLPSVIHVSAASARAPHWFHSTQQFIETELIQEQPGFTAMVDRLSEVLFIQAIRSRIATPTHGDPPSWLQALADPQLAHALRLMHTELDRPWSVTALAQEVSMSRSAFATRFRERVGATPMDHLTRWRMVRAAGMIRDGRPAKLAAVAAAVGYESESAFGKVFQRVMGLSPGRYRRLREHGTEPDSTELNAP